MTIFVIPTTQKEGCRIGAIILQNHWLNSHLRTDCGAVVIQHILAICNQTNFVSYFEVSHRLIMDYVIILPDGQAGCGRKLAFYLVQSREIKNLPREIINYVEEESTYNQEIEILLKMTYVQIWSRVMLENTVSPTVKKRLGKYLSLDEKKLQNLASLGDRVAKVILFKRKEN